MSRFDVAVIGGGVAGLSAAAELSARGSVILLEAEDALGFHASGRSASMFLPCYGNATVRAMNEASAGAHHDAGVLTPRRFLIVAPEAKKAAFEAEVAELNLTEIGPGAAQEMLPILRTSHMTEAATRDAWDLDTDLLMQTMRKRATADGARFETRARITALTQVSGGWRIDWADGTVIADTVVIAAGAWSDGIAALAGLEPLGLVPHRRSVAQLAAPGGHDVSDWPFVEEVGEAWYSKPDAGRWLVSPADADPVEPGDAWADDMVLAEGLARYQEAVTEEVTRPLHSWAGLRTFAPDRTLVIGPDPRAKGLWWLAGQGGYGFQTAPAAARHLLERMDACPPTLGSKISTALDPARLALK